MLLFNRIFRQNIAQNRLHIVRHAEESHIGRVNAVYRAVGIIVAQQRAAIEKIDVFIAAGYPFVIFILLVLIADLHSLRPRVGHGVGVSPRFKGGTDSGHDKYRNIRIVIAQDFHKRRKRFVHSFIRIAFVVDDNESRVVDQIDEMRHLRFAAAVAGESEIDERTVQPAAQYIGK